MPTMNSYSHTYVCNISEDTWPFLQSLDPSIQEKEIIKNAYLGEKEFLGLRAEYCNKNTLMIAPIKPSEEFIKYVDSLLPGNTTFICPENQRGQVTLEILENLNNLQQISKSHTISSYCPSDGLYSLLDKLANNLLSPQLIDTPEKKSWDKMSSFGTKVGFRKLIDGLNNSNLYQPKGKIFNEYEKGIIYASTEPIQEGVVIKTEKGCSSLGVVIIDKNNLPKNKLMRKKRIDEFLQKNGSYWNLFPMVVERAIKINPSIGGGIPFVGGYVNENGKVKTLFCSGTRIIDNSPSGYEITDSIFSEKILNQLKSIGLYLGKIYAENGYRGYYDIDFLIDKNQKTYLAESNIRRTGSTYVYHVARKLLGDNFTSSYYLLTNTFNLNQKHLSISQFFSKIQSVLFNHERKSGIIPIAPSLINLGKISYLVIAKNKSQGTKIENKFIDLIKEN